MASLGCFSAAMPPCNIHRSSAKHALQNSNRVLSSVLVLPMHTNNACTRKHLRASHMFAEPRSTLPEDAGEVKTANSLSYLCNDRASARDLTADQISTKDIIGEGATSVVYRCRSGGQYVAIKSPSSPEARRSATSPQACDEFRRSRRLHHDNIVGYLALECQGNLVMEFIDGGSLADAIARSGALVEEHVVQVAKQVLMGLAYMHENGLIHRDVKPANILIDTRTNTFKLCDWIGEEEASNCVHSLVGTPVFLAPEVVRSGRHCLSSDTWALGCTVLNLVTGTLPWSSEDNVFAAMFKTANGHAPPHPQDLSLPLRDLLSLSFEPNATLRPAPNVLLAIMLASHPDFVVSPGLFT